MRLRHIKEICATLSELKCGLMYGSNNFQEELLLKRRQLAICQVNIDNKKIEKSTSTNGAYWFKEGESWSTAGITHSDINNYSYVLLFRDDNGDFHEALSAENDLEEQIRQLNDLLFQINEKSLKIMDDHILVPGKMCIASSEETLQATIIDKDEIAITDASLDLMTSIAAGKIDLTGYNISDLDDGEIKATKITLGSTTFSESDFLLRKDSGGTNACTQERGGNANIQGNAFIDGVLNVSGENSQCTAGITTNSLNVTARDEGFTDGTIYADSLVLGNEHGKAGNIIIYSGDKSIPMVLNYKSINDSKIIDTFNALSVYSDKKAENTTETEWQIKANRGADLESSDNTLVIIQNPDKTSKESPIAVAEFALNSVPNGDILHESSMVLIGDKSWKISNVKDVNGINSLEITKDENSVAQFFDNRVIFNENIYVLCPDDDGKRQNLSIHTNHLVLEDALSVKCNKRLRWKLNSVQKERFSIFRDEAVHIARKISTLAVFFKDHIKKTPNHINVEFGFNVESVDVKSPDLWADIALATVGAEYRNDLLLEKPYRSNKTNIPGALFDAINAESLGYPEDGYSTEHSGKQSLYGAIEELIKASMLIKEVAGKMGESDLGKNIYSTEEQAVWEIISSQAFLYVEKASKIKEKFNRAIEEGLSDKTTGIDNSFKISIEGLSSNVANSGKNTHNIFDVAEFYCTEDSCNPEKNTSGVIKTDCLRLTDLIKIEDRLDDPSECNVLYSKAGELYWMNGHGIPKRLAL